MSQNTYRMQCCVVVCLLLAALLPALAARVEVSALRVADGVISVDGRDTDWLKIVEREASRITAADEKHLYFINTDRGVYGGPADSSIETWLAVDTQKVYLFANVHDQSLFNDTRPDNTYEGDDFEVFIDANPPEARFAKVKNENVRQLIFLPAYLNPQQPKDFVWQAANCPGVVMASHLTPWGYQIEISIPKALFPAWKANPEMDSFGFDVQAVDADSPGQDGMHPSYKYACILLTPGVLFDSSVDYGNATVSPQPATLVEPPAASRTLLDIDAMLARIPTATEADAPTLAQALLDNMRNVRISEAINVALDSKLETLRKTALFMLAKRPEIAAPIDKLLAIAAPLKDVAYGQIGAHDILCYTLVALAERHQLPVDDWFGFYTRLPNPQVSLTYCWSLGINGDRHATPLLAKLLYDSNLRIRIKAAMALGELKDPNALPALEEMLANDPHHYARVEAQNSIKKITGK